MKLSSLLLTVTILAVHLTQVSVAGNHCCHHCGCDGGCERVCRLVREEKKVTITCWGCKCEDFCAPGKSCEGCQNYEEVCDDCTDPEVCSRPKNFVWSDWEPGCAKHIYTKKLLMRKTITKKIPSYKWVVEDLCRPCQNISKGASIPAGTQLPPPPISDARLIYSVEVAATESTPEFPVMPVSNPIRPTPSVSLKSLFGSSRR